MPSLRARSPTAILKNHQQSPVRVNCKKLTNSSLALNVKGQHHCKIGTDVTTKTTSRFASIAQQTPQSFIVICAKHKNHSKASASSTEHSRIHSDDVSIAPKNAPNVKRKCSQRDPMPQTLPCAGLVLETNERRDKQRNATQQDAAHGFLAE